MPHLLFDGFSAAFGLFPNLSDDRCEGVVLGQGKVALLPRRVVLLGAIVELDGWKRRRHARRGDNHLRQLRSSFLCAIHATNWAAPWRDEVGWKRRGWGQQFENGVERRWRMVVGDEVNIG